MIFPIRNILLFTVCCGVNPSYAQAIPSQTAPTSNEVLGATIIGSSSPDYNPNRVSSGVLITQGDTQILVDMGDGVKRNLDKAHIDIRKMDALLFTHHHLDHNADFSPVFIKTILGRESFLVAGPTQTKELVDNNLSLYKQDLNYRLGKTDRNLDQRLDSITTKELKGGDSFTIDDIKVSTISVPHTIDTIAYRFDYKDQSIVITGDLSSGPGVAEFSQNANCLINLSCG